MWWMPADERNRLLLCLNSLPDTTHQPGDYGQQWTMMMDMDDDEADNWRFINNCLPAASERESIL